VDNLEKVLEKLAISEKTTIVVAREIDGKMRVTSGSWEGEKVFASSIWLAPGCYWLSEPKRTARHL
jgi:hypothetical protein